MSVTRFLPHFLARQFKTVECSDFPGVLIPLEHATRHHSVVSKAEKDGADLEPTSSDEKIEKGDVRRASVAAYDVHTIEGLRAEIEGDMSAFGLDSTYDRTCR